MYDLIDDPALTADETTLADLPNDRLILSRGLLSLVLIAIGFVMGLIFAKLCMDQARVALAAYELEPHKYRPDSLSRVKRGKLLATIGLGIFALELLLLIGFVYLVDWE
jgi:hypothetical protein